MNKGCGNRTGPVELAIGDVKSYAEQYGIYATFYLDCLWFQVLGPMQF